jgi:hypothetical protein
MPFNVTVHHGLPHLLVETGGTASLTDLCGLADLVATIAARMGYRRALIDLSASELSSLSFTNHLTLGAYAAERFGRLEQVATVVTPADRKGTSEKAAQKLGLHLRTFTDLGEAVSWISAGPQ